MKVLGLVLVLSVLVYSVLAQDYDDGRQGDVLENIDSLLRNHQFMEAQTGCVRGTRACDRVGRKIKNIVQELQKKKKCTSCSAKERAQMRKVIDYVRDHPKYNNFWKELNIPDSVVRNLD